jgi:hypothetical protein
MSVYFVVGVIDVNAGDILGNNALSKLPNILYTILLCQSQPDIATTCLSNQYTLVPI